jgi:hypothetical protein
VLLKYKKSTTTCKNLDIDKQDSYTLSTTIANKIERDIQASDIAMNKVRHFSQNCPSHEHRT